MKAKTEKEAIRFVTGTLAMGLLAPFLDDTQRIIMPREMTTKVIVKTLIGEKHKAAKAQMTPEQQDRLLLIKRAMEILAQKLVNCENEAMLENVVMAVNAINTSSVGILPDGVEMIES